MGFFYIVYILHDAKKTVDHLELKFLVSKQGNKTLHTCSLKSYRN